MKSIILFIAIVISGVANSYEGKLIEVVFVAESEFQSGIAEYEELWKEYKKDIMSLMNKYSRLHFKERDNRIKAILIDGPSHSGAPFKAPMRLRYNYSKDVKLGTLVHELGHRLLVDISRSHPALDSHEILFLILYDVWVELRGEWFANRMVAVEKNRSNRYRELWENALGSTKQEREAIYLRYLR